MAPCLSTLFARYSQRTGFFIVQTAKSTLGSLLVRSVKKTSYCLKQVLHRNVLAGNQSNSFLLTHGDRRFNIHVHNYAIFSSKIRINVALRCYMQMYQWTLILRVSFSSSQSTCMPCVLHLMYQISLSCCLQNDGYKCKESRKCLLCCFCVWSIKDDNKSILIFIEKWISKKIIDI